MYVSGAALSSANAFAHISSLPVVFTWTSCTTFATNVN